MNTCSICIEPLNNSKKQLKCKHEFHTKCIENWYSVQQNCPICRSEITQSEFIIEPYYVSSLSSSEPCNDYSSLSSSEHVIIRMTPPRETKTPDSTLKIIFNLFLFFAIVGSFIANIFIQNNLITEINNHNNTVGMDVVDIDFNNTFEFEIDFNNTNTTEDGNKVGSDSFYIAVAILYMCSMLILTVTYITKINTELNPYLSNYYGVFYIVSTIMFCTHLYYFADVNSKSSYHDYQNYIITSMTSLAILIFSFIYKLSEHFNDMCS